ncbi:MAG TPA: tail fiber domain-containing protein, partial [Saprospiraceae bacterium]|nr:tail fiber domain-containing protein [Saprospiraceae bacterium]
NIHDDHVPGLSMINHLRPVTYQFDTRKFDEHIMQLLPDSTRHNRMEGNNYEQSSSRIMTGFLAQEVELVCNDLGYTFSGLHIPESEIDNYGIAYGSFVPILVKGMQEQQAEIETLQNTVSMLVARLETLTAMIENTQHDK